MDNDTPVAQPLSVDLVRLILDDVIEPKVTEHEAIRVATRLNAYLDAARSVPSDRPASGLTDPDNAALREAAQRAVDADAAITRGNDKVTVEEFQRRARDREEAFAALRAALASPEEPR